MKENLNGESPRKVLVVDDSEATVRLLSRWMTDEGYTVVTAASGEAALAAAREHQPDLMLLDISIPWPSGFEVCKTLKSDPATRRMSVVLITGLQDPQNRVTGLHFGAEDVFVKPFDALEIKTKVRSLLRRQQYREQMNSPRPDS